LEFNSRLTPSQIATMLDIDVEEVCQRIKELEEDKTIISYHTLINWEKVGEEKVSAVIEVKVAPQRDVGFDAIAERIYRFPEVTSVHLVSGGYDLAVLVEGKSMKDVALFVAMKLSTLDTVLSTHTHFVLKTYKRDGIILEDGEKDRRLVVTP
ncbi:MAG TPA: Lrp/AsnC family transcriptional regulator, partial [Clostridia bacterium]|nr:Lrp/AsnC family transcriptional regulator [Clostridia bacterium]